ncbi:hypothetical protein L873DRAFT_1802815 [Choiromyces venosus 120613-1]|uniref:Uncharacterized protein n=1 Tax=Choiromyces venosus 120613-1 TaxID=1336337 RepID=A0A3N4JUE6_9PEZI|nr:hypothetical protein L873DRAFT_1802815 [Choiromyces venosus 120613-1]
MDKGCTTPNPMKRAPPHPHPQASIQLNSTPVRNPAANSLSTVPFGDRDGEKG